MGWLILLAACFQPIENKCLSQLEHGARSVIKEEALAALYGANISQNENTISVFSRCLGSKDLDVVIRTLELISQWRDETTGQMIKEASGHPHPLVKLIASACLIERKDPNAVAILESIERRCPKSIRPIFPSLYIKIGSPHADAKVKTALRDNSSAVRLEALRAIASSGRDDFLPQLRRALKRPNPPEQILAALTIAKLKDQRSAEHLKQLLHSPQREVNIAGNYTLAALGSHEHELQLAEFARGGHLSAIQLLSHFEGHEDFFYTLIQQGDATIRLHAAIALLEMQDPRAASELLTILTSQIFEEDDHYTVKERFISDNERVKSLILRERLLTLAADLPEETFLKIADGLVEKRQDELIPLLIHLVENMRTENAINFLKKHQQKVGSPLVRQFATLALYRLEEGERYQEDVRRWVKEAAKTTQVHFRPRAAGDLKTLGELTPDEQTTLFIESVATLADEKDVYVLVDAMEEGTPVNRYLLSGLIMRAVQ